MSAPGRVNLITASEVELAALKTPMGDALDLLRTAVLIAERIVAGHYPPDRVDSVTWRAADALLILRDYAEQTWPGSPTPGANRPTGRGAMLRPGNSRFTR